MKVSNNKQSTNFNGTTRIMGFGYTKKADNISKSLVSVKENIDRKNYDLFVKKNKNNDTIDIFVQKSIDYVKGVTPKSVHTVNSDEDKFIPKIAQKAINDFISNDKKVSLKEKVSKFFNK